MIGAPLRNLPFVEFKPGMFVRFDEQYALQKGSLFTLPQPDADGTLTGFMSHPFPGIHRRVEIEMEGEYMVVSGILAPDDRLVLW
jgi:hypothetical protein